MDTSRPILLVHDRDRIREETMSDDFNSEATVASALALLMAGLCWVVLMAPLAAE